MRAKKNIHLSGFEIGGMIVARKCTFKKEITCSKKIELKNERGIFDISLFLLILSIMIYYNMVKH